MIFLLLSQMLQRICHSNRLSSSRLGFRPTFGAGWPASGLWQSSWQRQRIPIRGRQTTSCNGGDMQRRFSQMAVWLLRLHCLVLSPEDMCRINGLNIVSRLTDTRHCDRRGREGRSYLSPNSQTYCSEWSSWQEIDSISGTELVILSAWGFQD